jgi:hypothetical protein
MPCFLLKTGWIYGSGVEAKKKKKKNPRDVQQAETVRREVYFSSA